MLKCQHRERDKHAMYFRMERRNTAYGKNNFMDNGDGIISEIYKLVRQSYYVEDDIGFSRGSTGFTYTEHLISVDKIKRIRGIYNGTVTLYMTALINDIRTLQNEK